MSTYRHNNSVQDNTEARGRPLFKQLGEDTSESGRPGSSQFLELLAKLPIYCYNILTKSARERNEMIEQYKKPTVEELQQQFTKVHQESLGVGRELAESIDMMSVGEVRETIAKSGLALCRATKDGAVWIGHVKDKACSHPFKLPATMLFEAESQGLLETDGYREVWYEEQGNVVSRFGLKLVYGSTLVSVLSASIAALVL